MANRDSHPCGGMMALGTGCGDCAWCEMELEMKPGMLRIDDGYDLIEWDYEPPKRDMLEAVLTGAMVMAVVALVGYLVGSTVSRVTRDEQGALTEASAPSCPTRIKPLQQALEWPRWGSSDTEQGEG